jgi:hypothetical protein
LYGEPSNFHPFFKIGIMSNHFLNIGNDPDRGSVRRVCVIPHRLEFKACPVLEHERDMDDKVKDNIKSKEHIHVFFHMLTTLYGTLGLQPGTGTLGLQPGTQLRPRPLAVQEATARVTSSTTTTDIKSTILSLITHTAKQVDGVDKKELLSLIKAKLPHTSETSIASMVKELLGNAIANGRGSCIFRYKFPGKANALPVCLSAAGKLLQTELAVETALDDEQEDTTA